MINEQLKAMRDDALERLLQRRSKDGMWRGQLSSSAISTSVSIFALQRIDAEKYAAQIRGGVMWLRSTMKPDGSWGDSVESPSNMTATLLTYVSLYAVGEAPEASRRFLNSHFGGDTEEALIQGVLSYYGKDLTFSVPILMMCALSGVISNWKHIPPFPFELATLPQRFFRYLNLPVVSYAIPALIAIGICQMERSRNLLTPLRRAFVPKALRILTSMQPVDGGYLEAAPLTGFVSMCLAEAGYKDHPVTQQCARFLIDTVRSDGAWPIDTNLSAWVTCLSAKAIAHLDIIDRRQLADIIKGNASTSIHPFTGAKAGGWGWSDLSGSVPDGDDTSGSLVALYHLTDGLLSKEVENGLRWLLWLQNRDGGMPTFCKGWGKLPFDRSSPDISAHAILAMGLWMPHLQEPLKSEVECGYRRLIEWMKCSVASSGSTVARWIPLWFGDQDAQDEKAPVYGTATAIDYLMSSAQAEACDLAASMVDFLLQSQNEDGGWGGNKGVASKVTYTSRVLAALSHFPKQYEAQRQRGWQWLYDRYQQGHLYDAEPIGLYFSRLWYSEELYNLTFLLHAFRNEGL